MQHLRSFGEQLRRHREAAGLSQQELAEQAGLTANAVGALERGEQEYRVPPLEQSPTMRLLTTRVRAVDPHFEPTPENTELVASFPSAKSAAALLMRRKEKLSAQQAVYLDGSGRPTRPWRTPEG